MEESPISRGFIAHELSHARRSLLVGEGKEPLGTALNELYAEWSGDNKNAYYTEKHMANLMACAGLDIRKDYLPKVASGEIGTADVIHALKDQFGSENTLRFLGYMPSVYGSKSNDDPAAIVGDSVEFALKNGHITHEQIQTNVRNKYTPEVAHILVTNPEIRAIIPSNLYPYIAQRAEEVN